jgi:tetratricopeptide (TPR) repeat protein
MCEWGRGNFAAAKTWYEKVDRLELEELSPNLAAHARNNLALVAWKAGDLAGAGKLFKDALCLRQKAGDKFGITATLMNLGIIEENLGHYAAAERHYRASLETAGKIRYQQAIACLYSNMGNLELCRENYAEALVHNAKALDLARQIGDRRSAAIALENLALSHLGLGQPKEARAHLAEARRVARHIGDKERAFSLDLVEIELLLEKGETRRALTRLSRVANQLEGGGYDLERPRLLRLHALYCLKSGDRNSGMEAARSGIREARCQHNRAEEARLRKILSLAGRK